MAARLMDNDMELPGQGTGALLFQVQQDCFQVLGLLLFQDPLAWLQVLLFFGFQGCLGGAIVAACG